MTTFQTFEQISAWQKSRELTKDVHTLTSKGDFSKDYGLKNQMRTAAVSIMSNIAEGFERSGTGKFSQFLAIAKGSEGEIRSQLYVAFDQCYVLREEFDTVSGNATEVARMISGLMSYLRGSGIKGTKFKKANLRT